MEAAMDLYQADFLAGFDVRDSRGFEEWVLLERERLQRTAVHVLRRLIDHHHRRGSYKTGIDYTARLLHLDPLSEWAHRQMMLLLARNDQRTAALQQFQHCCDILEAELAIDPSPETTAVYDRIRAAAERRRHLLPPENTPFVGREAALQTIGARLSEPDCRLLTLVGPGGGGKTRLALAAARRRPGAFLHGAAFVPLAGTPTGEQLPAAIAAALDFSFSGGRRPLLQLQDYLAEKELLLILDNYEHLLPDTTLIVTLLQAAPDLKILVTSRQRLNLQKEWAFDVQGMALPAGDGADSDAVQLFLQAARRAQADFTLSDPDAAAVQQICRLVAGLPLGIELAASWVRQLSCAEIAVEIERELTFLHSSAADLPQRHRSLQAVFDHSWGLLPAAEQAALAATAVFRGGFRREAAQQIAGVSLWILSALVDKSLLERGGDGRYSMHESIRQFAAEKLAADPDNAAQAAAAHAAYYSSLLRHHQHNWTGPDRQTALAQLMPESENINIAWEWAAQNRDLILLQEALVSLYFLFELRGQYQEGAAAFGWAMAALMEADAAAVETVLYARLALRYGKFHLSMGNREQAQKILQEILPILSREEGSYDQIDCLNHLAIGLSFSGQFAAAMARTAEALSAAERADNPLLIAFSRNLQGTLHQRTGDYAAAERQFAASLALRQQLGNQYGAAVVLNNMGNLAIARNQFAPAKEFYARSVEMFEQINHQPGRAAALTNSGFAALRSGDLDEARKLLDQSLLLKQNLGNQRSIAITLINLGELEIALGEMAPARRHLLDALGRLYNLRIMPLLLDAVGDLAAIRAAEGDVETAVPLFIMVQNQPETTSETAEKVRRQLAALGDGVTAALRAQGEEMGWEKAVQNLLRGF
jgi:predicted ATPase/Tfp pilus assembly protein PilF